VYHVINMLSFEDHNKINCTNSTISCQHTCSQKAINSLIMIHYFHCNRAIKREEEKSLEKSLNEAIVDSSLDTPVSPKPGTNVVYGSFLFDFFYKQLPNTVVTLHLITYN